MFGRSRSARWSEGVHRRVLFSEQVDEIFFANRMNEDERDELEKELTQLVGEPLIREQCEKSKEEELAEELEAILQGCSLDNMEDEIDQNRSCRPRVQTPQLAESATTGCTVEIEVEKRNLPDAIQMDFGGDPGQPSSALPAADPVKSSRLGRTERVIDLLNQRRRELRLAAYQAQQVGEMELAKQHVNGIRNITAIIQAVENEKPFDLALLPSKPCLNTVFSGPVLSGVVCEAPALVRLDLEQANDSSEQENILTHLLKTQVVEAMQLAQEQTLLKSTRTAQELKEMANGSQSTITMLSVQHKHRISLIPQFRAATLPIINKNGDMPDGVVEITVAWGVKTSALNTSDGFQLPSSYVHILFPYPSESEGQNHLSAKAPFNGRYSRGRSVKEIRANTKSWFVRRWASIRLNLYLSDIKGQKNGGRLLETLTIPLRKLEQMATVTSTHLLQNQIGVVEVKLRQRLPTSGSHLTTRVQPWLCVTAVPVVSIRPVSIASPLDQSSTKMTPRAPSNLRQASACDNSTKTSLSASSSNVSTTMKETNLIQSGRHSLQKVLKPDRNRKQNTKDDNNITLTKPLFISTNVSSVRPVTASTKSDVDITENASTVNSKARTLPNNTPNATVNEGTLIRTESLQSQALLRSQERLHQNRIRDPGITEEARHYHFNELRRTRILLKNLEQRLSGPKALQERQNYLRDLERLKSQLELLSLEAKKRSDIPKWTSYQYKLNVINEEIRSLK